MIISTKFFILEGLGTTILPSLLWPIVLRGILDTEYYEPFMLLSEGIYILLKDYIEEPEVYFVKQLMYKFCLIFPYLYGPGERYCAMNIHQLVHLPDDGLELAGLLTHSCFGFKNENHFTLKLFNMELRTVSFKLSQQFVLSNSCHS